MTRTKILTLFSAILVAITACQPLPAREVNPTIVPWTSTSSSAAASSAVSSASSLPVIASQGATPTPVVVDEEDCMAVCHIPDSNEFFAAGAKPQPASHVKQATCLNCHATLKTPDLPETHVGRMDPSCVGCHVESAK